MKVLLIILLILINFKLMSQNIWEITQYKEQDMVISIECPDSLNCFILTENNMTWSGKIILHHSINQGKSWTILKSIDTSFVQNLSSPDSNTIFISFKNNEIYKSTDGGLNFNKFILEGITSFDELRMYNKDMGIAINTYIQPNVYELITTRDCWKTFEKFSLLNDTTKLRFKKSRILNDSVVIGLAYNLIAKEGYYFFNFNIISNTFYLNFITNYSDIVNVLWINDNLVFACGQSNIITGGSCHDAIYKSTDAGRTWRRVLDLYSDDNKFDRIDHQPPPFGLQSIAFKDSLTGIAVGQFGKFVYTYDGGESWIYERDFPQQIGTPATMQVKYAGSVPNVATFDGYFLRMTGDNLASKKEDIYSISGRVYFDGKGQPDIPVAIGYRVTMTDADGYYKFTRLAKGNYKVKVLNKYYDFMGSDYFYKPFDYTPENYEIVLTHDTSGFDFNAIDYRLYYNAGGYIFDTKGNKLKGILVEMDDSTTYTDSDGHYYFSNVVSKMQNIRPYSKNYKFTPWHYEKKLTADTDTFNFVATPVTSIEENIESINGLSISPNPATEFITIHLQPSKGFNPSEGSFVEIYDMLGVKVISEPIHPMTLSHRMNVDLLPVGLYFVKIGDRFEKFVKM